MRHERWPRLLALWRREAGRSDPTWPPEGLWSCGERIGAWGLSRSYQDGVEALRASYDARGAAMLERHKAEFARFSHGRDRHLRRYTARAEGELSHNNHVELRPDGVISFLDGRDRVELCRFIGSLQDLEAERRTKRRGEHQATVLINGDGFDIPRLQSLQAQLRLELTRHFGQNQVMILPYQALAAAGVEIPSIKRIAVTRDGGETVTVRLPGPLPKDLDAAVERIKATLGSVRLERDYWDTPSFEFNSRGARFSVLVRKRNGVELRQVRIWRQALDAVPGWHDLRHTSELGWHVAEWRHRLGASVFSAKDERGERHRYLSAFDSQERPPMYFLAQLPDYGRVWTYDEALDILAPPIVHEARLTGRRVYRQGDVFFIATELTHSELVTRGARIHSGEGRGMYHGRPNRGRNIYGTGHIATHVALLPNGVALARGRAEHFPAFNGEGRTPEHTPIQLTEPDGWYLCIRNTVPRSANTDSGSQDSPGQGSAGTLQLDDPSINPERSSEELALNGNEEGALPELRLASGRQPELSGLSGARGAGL